MTPKRFRKLITKWRFDEYQLGVDFPNPMTAKEIAAFIRELPFTVAKKHLQYTIEFGGKFNDPYAAYPDSIVPGNFSKSLRLGEFYLLTGTDIIEEHKGLKSLLDEGAFHGMESNPSYGVKNCWLHEQWIPFAANGAGDYMCIDLAPADNGMKGQVIAFAHESALRPRFANSTHEFFDKLAVSYSEDLIILTDEEYKLRKLRVRDFPTFDPICDAG